MHVGHEITENDTNTIDFDCLGGLERKGWQWKCSPDGTNTDASLLVPFMWYVPDAITIDGVYSLEGMTTSSANVTRMHLYSFDFTSGSTSALTNGATLAYNTDVSNAGSEQAYLSTWVISSSSVTAGKVILAFFRMDTVADDPSVSITVKYHEKNNWIPWLVLFQNGVDNLFCIYLSCN